MSHIINRVRAAFDVKVDCGTVRGVTETEFPALDVALPRLLQVVAHKIHRYGLARRVAREALLGHGFTVAVVGPTVTPTPAERTRFGSA